jgi:hypothetical protein
MKMTRTTILVTDVFHHHTEGTRPVREGMSLQEALKDIRANRDSFGSIGGMTAELSDGSHLAVECQSCEGGRCQLMSSQRIERRTHDTYTSTDKLVRVYPW